MELLATSVAEIIDRLTPTDGLHPSPVPAVDCIKISESGERAKRHWRASLYIIAQGKKEVMLGREVYVCDAVHYAVTPIDLPVTSRAIGASLAKPFLCLRLGFESPAVREALATVKQNSVEPAPLALRALFVEAMTPALRDATGRLARLFLSPLDATALGPLVVQEIFYYILSGPEGSSILQFLRSGNAVHKISHAVHCIKATLHDEINIGALAGNAGMSRSAFFQRFKQLTALSPVQYQKRLRLLEARRLLTENDATAEQSAYEVGYQSASQFSREYSRMFGHPPRQDAERLKRNAHVVPPI